MKIVRVTWLDSESSKGGWIQSDEFDSFIADALAPITTVAYLYAERDDHIVLVQSRSATAVDGDITIPRVAILTMEELEAP